jgi:hypothetical protein
MSELKYYKCDDCASECLLSIEIDNIKDYNRCEGNDWQEITKEQFDKETAE